MTTRMDARATPVIMIVSNIAWTISQFRLGWINSLTMDGYKVYCVADLDKFSPSSLSKINSVGAHFIRLKLSRKGTNPLSDAKYFLQLLRIYARLRPDVVVHYTVKPNIYGSFAAKILKIPSIAVITGIGSSMMQNSPLSSFVSALYAKALAGVPRVCFLNSEDEALFLRNGWAREDQTTVLPGEGVDMTYYRKRGTRPFAKKTFLMVSRIMRDKGVYEYVEAARQLKRDHPEAVFLLAGVFDEDNPTAISSNEVRGWEEEGLVRYLGVTDDIRDFFEQCEVVVLPSYREGLSRLLLEAASCEKPLIASDVPGCREVVIDGFNGYLCQPGDVASLREAMEKMIGSDQLERYGKNGRHHVEKNFNDAIVNHQLTSMLRAIRK